MDLLVMDAYINLASAIVLQAYKDLEIYEAEDSEKISAEWFIQSKEKDYLIKMITWWKKLRDEMGEMI